MAVHRGGTEGSRFHLRVGASNDVGGKKKQEDYCVCVSNMNELVKNCHNNVRCSYYAVFDGHGGENASRYLAENLHIQLAAHPKFIDEPIAALEETWAEAEHDLYEFLNIANVDKLPRDGSTATVCLIVGDVAYITNCGDSSAYMLMRDGTCALVSEIHNTGTDEEVRRCQEAGGTVRQVTHNASRYLTCWDCIRNKPRIIPSRLYPGGLLVTRSFGDFHAKLPALGGIAGTVVCQHGQVRMFKLSTDIKYIILGSDGIWDAMLPAQAFASVQNFLAGRAKTRLVHPAAVGRDIDDELVSGSNLIAKPGDLDYLLTAAARNLCTDAAGSIFWRRNIQGGQCILCDYCCGSGCWCNRFDRFDGIQSGSVDYQQVPYICHDKLSGSVRGRHRYDVHGESRIDNFSIRGVTCGGTACMLKYR